MLRKVRTTLQLWLLEINLFFLFVGIGNRMYSIDFRPLVFLLIATPCFAANDLTQVMNVIDANETKIEPLKGASFENLIIGQFKNEQWQTAFFFLSTRAGCRSMGANLDPKVSVESWLKDGVSHQPRFHDIYLSNADYFAFVKGDYDIANEQRVGDKSLHLEELRELQRDPLALADLISGQPSNIMWESPALSPTPREMLAMTPDPQVKYLQEPEGGHLIELRGEFPVRGIGLQKLSIKWRLDPMFRMQRVECAPEDNDPTKNLNYYVADYEYSDDSNILPTKVTGRHGNKAPFVEVSVYFRNLQLKPDVSNAVVRLPHYGIPEPIKDRGFKHWGLIILSVGAVLLVGNTLWRRLSSKR